MHDRPTKDYRGAGGQPAVSIESRRQSSCLHSAIKSLRPDWVALVLLCCVCCTTPASGHKLTIFATVQGNTVEGEVYFHDGTPARNAAVTVFDPGGEVLGKASTDQDGKFTFELRFRCDHKLIADAGLGHQAEYTVEADELPRDLPAGGSGDSVGEADPVSPATHDHQHGHQHNHEHGPAKPPDEENLTAEIQALAQQVNALRKDLDKWKGRLRLQDIVGGIGYILGIMGLVSYFLGARRKEKRATAGE